jgi:hypothetical protein
VTRTVLIVVAVLSITTVVALGQSKPSIQGAWRRVEVTVTNPDPTPGALTTGTHTNVQPGLLIFTAKHYSVQIDTAAKPRTPFKVIAKPTPEEMSAGWGFYTANSGTYELSGSTVTMRPMVSKNPGNQGKGTNRATIKLEKDNLWFTLIENASGKIVNPTTAKYVRVE